MKKIDYLIVGQGISGTSFAWRAYFAKQSFIIIDNEKSVTASKAALGIYNPITGRKFNISWNYNNLLNELNLHTYSFPLLGQDSHFFLLFLDILDR